MLSRRFSAAADFRSTPSRHDGYIPSWRSQDQDRWPRWHPQRV